MLTLSQIRNSLWRVPLISILAGILYPFCYVQLVLWLGVLPMIASGLLLFATFVLGRILLLPGQTAGELFLSSSIVVLYGLSLQVLQVLSGSTTGPAAVVFAFFQRPLEWTGFIKEVSIYCAEHFGFSIPFAGWLSLCTPWLFVLLGKIPVPQAK